MENLDLCLSPSSDAFCDWTLNFSWKNALLLRFCSSFYEKGKYQYS